MNTQKNPTIQEDDLEIQTTSDGSKTIARKTSGLLYRSVHGALQESTEVFVNGAQLVKIKNQWRVFELGFGTGMNFSTTYTFAQKLGVCLHYEAVDHLPIPKSYGTCIWAQKALELVRRMKDTVILPIPNGTLTLHPYSFEEVHIGQTFDAIYHDPFGPGANPDCWTNKCFQKESLLLSETGIWTSYGASGAMRRALAETGFYVAIGPGIGKKRETTRASKSKESLLPLKVKYIPTSS